MSHTKKIFLETLKSWTPLAVAILVFTFATYIAVQQNYRQSANDPQIQITEEITEALSQGAPAGSIVPEKGTTELTKSLSPFVIIYDSSNKIIGSSIIVDGQNPEYPNYVLDNAKNSGKQMRVTWEPKKGLRMATVVATYKVGDQTGTVVAGRSIREIESRSMQTLLITSLAGLFALVVTFLITWLFKKIDHPKTVSEHNHASF